MNKRNSVFLIILSFWIMCFSTSSVAAIDPAAAVVKLRVNCTNNGVALDDCFQTLWSLTSWIKTTRLPNANRPLKVEIGPGTFGPNVDAGIVATSITCNPTLNYTGYISFEGAGNNQTIITGMGSGSSSPLMVNSCTEMNFSHLQVTTTFYGAVEWSGGGISRWNDVQLVGVGRAWYESCGATPGTHYWTSSQLTATAAFSVVDTYDASCDESFFSGSQITISVPSTYGQGLALSYGGAVVASGRGIIHLYGSQLRAFIDGGASSQSNLVPAANAYNGGMIHIHGTGIDVSSTSGRNITALLANTGGMIHANSSAYVMKSTGTMTRINDNNKSGIIMAPYLWQEDASPPNIISVNGSDQVVITATSDGHPHPLIYDNTCPRKWYDTNSRTCY